MPQRTLNQLIADTLGTPSSDPPAAPPVANRDSTPAPRAEAAPNEVEKLASVLELIGRRGVLNVVDFPKEASMSKCAKCSKDCPPGSKSCPACGASMTKQAADTGTGAPANNAGKAVGGTTGVGKPADNGGSQPGGSGSVDTSSTQKGDHHPSLASSEAAINYDKREHAKNVGPALDKALKTTAFADPTLKQVLSGAGGKGDKNIHSKTAGHDLNAVRAELARRAAAAAPKQPGGEGQ